MLSFENIKQHVLDKLKRELSPLLTYHNVAHTSDVLKQVVEIALNEGIIESSEDFLLLKISALYHDIGFIQLYNGHEEASCEMARPDLINFGFTQQQIDKICGMIRATKVPQKPQNKLEEMICDADLDYLGRNDFYTIGEGLYKEFLDQHIVTDFNSWNRLQVKFLESHCYFTKTSYSRRQEIKLWHIKDIKDKLL